MVLAALNLQSTLSLRGSRTKVSSNPLLQDILVLYDGIGDDKIYLRQGADIPVGKPIQLPGWSATLFLKTAPNGRGGGGFMALASASRVKSRVTTTTSTTTTTPLPTEMPAIYSSSPTVSHLIVSPAVKPLVIKPSGSPRDHEQIWEVLSLHGKSKST